MGCVRCADGAAIGTSVNADRRARRSDGAAKASARAKNAHQERLCVRRRGAASCRDRAGAQSGMGRLTIFKGVALSMSSFRDTEKYACSTNLTVKSLLKSKRLPQAVLTAEFWRVMQRRSLAPLIEQRRSMAAVRRSC